MTTSWAAAEDTASAIAALVGAAPGALRVTVAPLRVRASASVVVVAVRDPYDIAYLAGVKTYLATYSYSPVAIESAVRVMVGEVAPTGKLPVDIPAAGDPTTALFAFGFGITW